MQLNKETKRNQTHLTWAVEYADCISADEKNKKQKKHLNECHRYDNKPSDVVVSVLELWGM